MKKLYSFIFCFCLSCFLFANEIKFPCSFLSPFSLNSSIDDVKNKLTELNTQYEIKNNEIIVNKENLLSHKHCFLCKYIQLEKINIENYYFSFTEDLLSKIYFSFSSIDFFTADELKNVLVKYFDVYPVDYFISSDNGITVLTYNFVDKNNEDIKIKVEYWYLGYKEMNTFSLIIHY